MRSRLLNLTAAISLAFFIATILGWSIGAMHPTVWRYWGTPQRSYFLRCTRWHLVFSEQFMNPRLMLPNFSLDSTRWGEYMIVTSTSGPFNRMGLRQLDPDVTF